MRAFDLYQKITVDNLIKPTITGAIISISSILLISFLLIKETIDYLTHKYEKSTIIMNHNKVDNEKLNFVFSIKLFNVPCSLVSIDQEDTIGAHRMDIKDNINKVRMTHDNKNIVGSYTAFKTDLLEKSIQEKENCFIKGQVDTSKASGNIHFSYHPYREIWYYLKENKPKIASEFNLSHLITLLQIGTKNEEILKTFGENENTEFLLRGKLPVFEVTKNQTNYDYYLKLIPHLFKDEINNKEYLTYQYSISHKSTLIESEHEMPAITINYDLSPITMQISLKRERFTHFLIHICAIIGGVYVSFSIINKMTLYLFEGGDLKSNVKSIN